MKTKDFPLAILVIIFIVGIACLGCNTQALPIESESATPTASPAKQIISNSLPLIEKWRWSGLIHNLFGPPIVAISKDSIVIATPSGKKRVVVFDVHTGNIIWEGDFISNLRSLHADNKRVYIGEIRYVKAYDLETGQVVWQGAEQDSFKRGGLLVYPEGERLQVYDPYDGFLYMLDSETGQTFEKTQWSRLFFKRGNIYYSGTCGTGIINCLDAINGQSGETLWSNDFEGGLFRWPIFMDDIMFVNAGGQLVAVNTETGEFVWQSTAGNFVTEMALGNELLYAIRDDATIVGINPKTGDQEGVIEIIPEQNIEYTGGYAPYYTIAASDKFVAAYYSNSQELIVFERVEDKR